MFCKLEITSADINRITPNLLTVGIRLRDRAHIGQLFPYFDATNAQHVIEMLALLIKTDALRWDDAAGTFKYHGNGGSFADVSRGEWQGILTLLWSVNIIPTLYNPGEGYLQDNWILATSEA